VGAEASVMWAVLWLVSEARVGREEPQACNGSLCGHYKGSVRVPQSWIAVAHGKKLPSNLELSLYHTSNLSARRREN
jgi:hypothetical protein